MNSEIITGRHVRRFFEGLVRYAFFEQLGVPDTRLTDYLAELLCRFVRMDAIFDVRDLQGRKLEGVAEMLEEVDKSLSPARERAIHKHIGDFVLFWAGIYPEFLRHLRAPYKKDQMIDYMAQGRRSYHIASTYDSAPFREEAPILRKLSLQLEICTVGLGLVRQGWESLAPKNYRTFRHHE